MNYYEEMLTKWGFSEGMTAPSGVETYREVYITAINRMATNLGSEFRVVPWDRSGMHNWCLILVAPIKLAELRETNEAEFEEQFSKLPDFEGDEKLKEAISQCHNMNLDSFVEVTVKADMDGLKKYLDDPTE